jgi:hypothetical protein
MSVFTKGLHADVLAAAKGGKIGGGTGAMGLYAHNAMANIANSSWGSSMAAGAAAGGIYGAGSGFVNNDGIIGSAAQGAFTGGLFGAGIKGASGMYSKNAAAHASGMMSFVDGKFATTIQAGGTTSPFKWSHFTEAAS